MRFMEELNDEIAFTACVAALKRPEGGALPSSLPASFHGVGLEAAACRAEDRDRLARSTDVASPSESESVSSALALECVGRLPKDRKDAEYPGIVGSLPP